MPTLILVRHARSTANADGVLAGRTPGVELDETGRRQASELGGRLRFLDVAVLVSSPLERCRQTAAAIAATTSAEEVVVEPRLDECDYGQWQGGKVRDLATEDLWKTVQAYPSGVVFPDGESLLGMQQRAVEAVREHDAAVRSSHGPSAIWVAVSHGDVIKAILADALGMHFDHFQRIHVEPASVSLVHYGDQRPSVLGVNSRDGDMSWLGRAPTDTGETSVPGGGAGPRDTGKGS